MNSLAIGILVFVLLSGASLGALYLSPRLPARHRDTDTETVVRLVAGIFTLMTSLVFGLMINSAKGTYETINSDVHAYATQLIILDRTLRHYGLPAEQSRQRLIAYAEEAIASPARAADAMTDRPDSAGRALDALGDTLAAIDPADDYYGTLAADARSQYRTIVESRWRLIEQSEGTIPTEIVFMLLAWLTLVFAGFGYRAPPNAVVITMFVGSSMLLGASFYLVLDMNVPFSGPIQVSDIPLHRALAEMKM